MKKTPFVICILMILTSLSGCFGGNDIETSEGDDVILGESTDDWPTYYVLTANDLPTCDANTLGRLYYVEADTNFQACMSTGWQVVQIGGASGNLVLNQPPSIEINFWFLDDDLVTDTTGNGEPDHMLIGMHWDAKDIDGTIASLGIDYDGDLSVDIPLSSNSGLYSSEDYTLDGESFPGLFAIPLLQGITVHKTQTPTTCLIGFTRTLSVIAVDDGGATGMASQTMSPVNPHTYSPIGGPQMFSAIRVMDEPWIQAYLSTADIDWITGQGSSTCPEPPSFTFTPATSFTTGTSDLIGTLTLDSGTATNLAGHGMCAYNEFILYLHHSDGSHHLAHCATAGDPGAPGGGNPEITFTSSGSPTVDTWTVSESGADLCNDATSDCTNMAAYFTIEEKYDGSYCWDAATQSNNDNACEW